MRRTDRFCSTVPKQLFSPLSRIVRKCHYENNSIQIYRKFHLQKLKNIQIKNSDIFHISAQNIDCGYSLEPPRGGGSNKYHNLCF